MSLNKWRYAFYNSVAICRIAYISLSVNRDKCKVRYRVYLASAGDEQFRE